MDENYILCFEAGFPDASFPCFFSSPLVLTLTRNSTVIIPSGRVLHEMYQKLFWSSLRATLDRCSVPEDVAPLKHRRGLGDWVLMRRLRWAT